MKSDPRPEILATHPAGLFDVAVRRAAELLRAGGVVALPTETVYGLAANALEVRAVAQLFAIKGRPAHNPIIVHVSSLEMARRCVRRWPETAGKLASAFWPGPLTLVLPRAREIPDLVTAGGDTVGVRWASHPLMQAVIRECGFPLAAPSANPSARLSPTTATHVREALGERVQLIIDGGPAQVGIESTVVDLTVRPARVLRPGMIHGQSLLAVLGESGLGSAECSMDFPRKSPGQLKKHYSPRAKLVVLNWPDEADLRRQISNFEFQISRCHVIAHSQIPSGQAFGAVSVIPRDAGAYARAIYAELHRCDAAGAAWIIVEALPSGPEWQAIADRLQRAAS